VIAESWDHPCAERLTPNLVWTAQRLASHDELPVSPVLLTKLAQVSVSTVRRILKGVGQERKRLPRPGPKRKPGRLQDIPMKRIPWNEAEPGHFEVDLCITVAPVWPANTSTPCR